MSTQAEAWMMRLHEDFCDSTKFLHAVREKFKYYRTDGLMYITHDPARSAQNFISWCEEVVSFFLNKKKSYVGDTHDGKEKIQNAEISHLENKIQQLEKDKTDAILSKDRALNRLSELQARMLKTGNPEISDLSDENRPTNLGQKFKQVYEDEWTDAFTFLTDDRPAGKYKDEEGIALLYNLLEQCNSLCSEAIALQGQRVKQVLKLPVFEDPLGSAGSGMEKLSMPASISSSTKGQKSPVDVQPASQRNQPLSKTIGPGSGLQQMATFQNMPQPNLAEFKDKCKVSEMDSQLEVPVREFCKAVASLSIGDDKLEAMIARLNRKGQIPADIMENKDIRLFLKRCLTLSWLMQVQYPPMVMDFSAKPGDNLNLEKWAVYQTRGPKVAFIIWPPILLHKDGPVVGKGYAEGRK